MGKEKSNNNHNGKDKSWEIIEFSEGEVKIKIDDDEIIPENPVSKFSSDSARPLVNK